MTVETAIRTCLNLLADLGVSDWNCAVIENFGPEHPNRMGLTSYERGTIFLSARYLDDDTAMVETIRHECSHVLCPPSAGGAGHNENWQRTLELVPAAPSTMSRAFRIELEPVTLLKVS